MDGFKLNWLMNEVFLKVGRFDVGLNEGGYNRERVWRRLSCWGWERSDKGEMEGKKKG